jgi:hypothetical protein
VRTTPLEEEPEERLRLFRLARLSPPKLFAPASEARWQSDKRASFVVSQVIDVLW